MQTATAPDNVVTPIKEAARNVTTDVVNKAQQYAVKAVDQTTQLVRRYPSQALIGCFGLGFLIGAALARK